MLHVFVVAWGLINVYSTQAFLEVPASQNEPLVNLECGKVRGTASNDGDAFSFRGIPYASPPIGGLRWQKPEPISPVNNNCWSGTLQANQNGDQCVQLDSQDIQKTVGSEDCLYLNVFTPSLNSSAKLPVMFWIHGGSLVVLNGSDPTYSPNQELANKLNVVFVSINYRLHAFGFLALKMLNSVSSTNTSGNYGLMDMVEALRWTQTNIHHFGGDSQKVTVFGQSSGGSAIVALLASPLCKNLFDKAWMLSASPVLNKTAEEAYVANEVFLNNTGCKDVTCLYNLTPEEVTLSAPFEEYPYWGTSDLGGLPEKGRFDGALPIVDGYVLHEAPFEAWVHGNGIDVPVLIGSTAQEVSQFITPPEAANWTWNDGNYSDYVRRSLGQFGDIVALTALKLYPKDVETPLFQLSTMISDARVTCGTDYLATIMASAYHSPVYRYIVTYTPKNQLSFHSIDIYGFFETLGMALGRNDEWENLVQKEAMAFVTGAHPATSTWTKYPTAVAELSNITTVAEGYHTAQCEFWLANNFFSYSWIN
ncbi:hypothetical protein ACF0H5_005417 [Mactra antiquata]